MFVSASRGAARVVELVDAPGSARIPGGEKSPCGFESRPGQSSLMADVQLPNKRLKLTGVERLEGIGVLNRQPLSAHVQRQLRQRGVARSLSAAR